MEQKEVKNILIKNGFDQVIVHKTGGFTAKKVYAESCEPRDEGEESLRLMGIDLETLSTNIFALFPTAVIYKARKVDISFGNSATFDITFSIL